MPAASDATPRRSFQRESRGTVNTTITPTERAPVKAVDVPWKSGHLGGLIGRSRGERCGPNNNVKKKKNQIH
ncbi:hypothetical protein DPEC_G00351980 [Dallia pectoralis]|uniref:Uncharacterized protein n=1 Tax=Dallia pectoralis TaxID=75939 RepID=A0ACC2F267_DALPE|nr:hypothetical protein DPEC_G00351980 [Dallia pectoralis]